MKTLSLKSRFAIGMSIGALALVTAMAALSMHYAQRDLLTTLSAEQLKLVTRVVDDLDGDLQSAVETLEQSANAMPRDLLADPIRFEAFFARSPALTRVFERFFVADASGTITAAVPGDKGIGIRVGDRRYFQDAMKTGKPVISEPLVGRGTGAAVVSIAVPIADATGRITAVMVGVLPLSRNNFLGQYAAQRIGRTGYFTVFTTGPEPVFLVHPDPARLMTSATIDQGRVMERMIHATSSASKVTRIADNTEALVTYKPLKMTNWVLATIIPGEEAFAVVAHAQTRIVELGIAAALIALPLAWSFAWLLLRPLSVLRNQVEAIARDPQDSSLPVVVRQDEVGEVASAFTAMLAGQRASELLRLASDQDRRRLVAILESSQDVVAMTSARGRLTYLNASGRRWQGIGLDDDLSDSVVHEFFPKWAADRLDKEGIPIALRDGMWVGETAILAKGGREIPVDHTIIAHRNIDGAVEFFSSLMHDTSEAQAATAAIRSSEARMLSIADALPVMVAFIDRDWRYRFVNSRYEDHFGVDKSRFIDRTIEDVIGDKAFAVYRPFLERAAAGESQIFELESHAGRRPVHFLVKLIPQFDEDDRVLGYHFIHQDVTDHKVENQRLSQLARADALTGLLNRAGFEFAIVDAMERSRHHLSAMALFYIDVDRFKTINDRFGHQVGDKLLRGFASRLVRALRSADVAARLGGDEFVVIAEGVRNVDDVRSIAGKILRAMRPEFDFNGTILSITSSIGVAIYAGEAIKVDDLIRRADAALYRAKDAGRDCYALDDELQSFGTTTLLFDNGTFAAG